MGEPKPTLALTSAQRAGIEGTDRSMAVTSGAGCGKTFVLTRRYLQLLAEDGQPDAPSRVVAVTFTDKAAIEMHQRVAELLAERMAAAADTATRRLLGEWLNRLPEARITTIHGFCTSLLRAFAVEAGVDPTFSVLADAFEVERMQNEATAEAALTALLRGDAAGSELLDYFSYDVITDMLAELLSERWRWSAKQYADPAEVLARWQAGRREAQDHAWESFDAAAARAEIEALQAVPCDDVADKLAAHLREQLRIMTGLLDNSADRTPETFGRLKSAGNMGSPKAWGSKETCTEVRRRLKTLIDAFGEVAGYFTPLNETDEVSARCLSALTALADDANTRYAAAKRRAGMLDFVDLLVGARDLLRDNKAVRRRVADEIRQMLIDEFQDTDSLQRELLYLAVDCTGSAPPPGRLFFVGDAKQSIYRFRGAEVDVFARAREAIADENRSVLDRSFRTHRPGVALVNAIFEPLLGREYEPLVAHRAEQPDAPAGEILLAECGIKPSAGDRFRAAAAAIAERIAEMVERGERRVWDSSAGRWRPVRPGDIAILLPRLTNTAPYEDSLHAAGVDHYVVAGAGLFRQQEVFDVLNALRAIDSPLDDIALVGFLRGGLVALSDEALLHLARTVEPPYRGKLRDERLTERLGPADRDRLGWAADVLDRLSARKDACDIDALIERLLAETGFEAALLGQYHGLRRCGNVHRVIEHARGAQAAGATLRHFIEFLSELTFQEVRAEQAAVEAEAGNVVRIMTIHKAKGLEFPVVFLGDLNYAPRPRFGALGIRGRLGLTLRTCPPGSDEEAHPRSWWLAKAQDSELERAENIRSFYVAVTRHRDYVAFVGAREETKDERLGKAGSPLRCLDDVLDLHGGLETGNLVLDDKAELTVRTLKPRRQRRHRAGSVLDDLYAQCDGPEALAERLAAPGEERSRPDEDLPHLAPVPVGGTDRLAVTAAAELEFCPASFRWHYELCVPAGALAGTGDAGVTPSGDGLDAATAGTVFHRCMELLDFADPQPAATLLPRVLAEMDLQIDPAALTAELDAMIAALRRHALWHRLTGARRRLAELEFVHLTDRLELTGVIDLLYQDAEGDWHILDYKSDRVSPPDVPAHAERYELQMLIYAAAAGRFLADLPDGPPPAEADAALYFLRPSRLVTFAAGGLAAAAERRLTDLADRLADCRRTGQWPRRNDDACRFCRYAVLCGGGS